MLENTKGLNALTSGRIDIYKAYMSKLNYSGHRSVSLVVGGHKKAHAHNNWLQFGYTYGILGMLFYGVITVLAIFFEILPDKAEEKCYVCIFDTGYHGRICSGYYSGVFIFAI